MVPGQGEESQGKKDEINDIVAYKQSVTGLGMALTLTGESYCIRPFHCNSVAWHDDASHRIALHRDIVQDTAIEETSHQHPGQLHEHRNRNGGYLWLAGFASYPHPQGIA